MPNFPPRRAPRRLLRAPALLLLALTASAAGRPTPGAVAHDHAPAGAGAAGSIEGLVEIAPSLAARRPRFRVYGDVGLGATPPDDRGARGGELANVVVYLVPRGATPRPDVAPAATAPEIRQEDERFVPRVLAVTRGATVAFPNEDEVYHNVFSLAKARTFDLGRYPRGATRSVRFDKAGIVQVFCHIHADMSATVLVLDTPYYTSPGGDGRFRLEGVPPGEYDVIGWHERARPVHRRVRVIAGESAHAVLSIPLPPEAQQP